LLDGKNGRYHLSGKDVSPISRGARTEEKKGILFQGLYGIRPAAKVGGKKMVPKRLVVKTPAELEGKCGETSQTPP